ncbi:MAG: pyridoxal-dependent decarboxylase [Pseudomonadota bacterium]
MTTSGNNQTEPTLDPDDWAATREVAHQMVDDMLDYLQSVRERPAWRTVPANSKDTLLTPIPHKGQPLADVYATFKEHILPFPTGNLHPAFFGWVMGNGTPTGMLADMLAAGMNAHLAGYDQSASLIEKQVIRWLAELVGYPADASGLLVSGGTMANLNALVVARHHKAGFDVRTQGLQINDTPMLRVYGSSETHSWIYKACEVMGLGRNAFRSIQVNNQFEIDVDACRQQIQADITAGERPFCINGNAGTVNTGAVDDLHALRELADEFDLWFHVDGAFGSLAAWSDDTRDLVAGQERADSMAFDLHKWGYMPYDIGCVVTRLTDAQNNAFATQASYLSPTQRGLAVDNTYFADKGIQLSRSFRALKAWMCMQEQGVDRIGQRIATNIKQARQLADLIEQHECLEVMAPVAMNIVCYRYIDPTLSDAQLNAINEEILLRIHESGTAVPSQTYLNGRFAIRVCNANHRTQLSDLNTLVANTIRFATQIVNEQAIDPRNAAPAPQN